MDTKNIKIVEIRDRATYIPAFAIQMLPQTEEELFLMKGAGYGFTHPCVMLIAIEAPWRSARSWDEWKSHERTMGTAHKWIEQNFEKIKTGEVIDVEYLLGEKDRPCQSVRYEKIKDLLQYLNPDEKSE